METIAIIERDLTSLNPIISSNRVTITKNKYILLLRCLPESSFCLLFVLELDERMGCVGQFVGFILTHDLAHALSSFPVVETDLVRTHLHLCKKFFG